MSATGDSQASVVHIRIIREKEHKISCDFCLQSFSSADQLSQHIISDHSSLDIQDVYVCPLCRCCLLCQEDLLDHLFAQHQVLINSLRQPAVCEFCGLCLKDTDSLSDHHRTSHHQGTNDNSVSERVELTLRDISNMGMGNPECKTLFQLIEYPIETSSVDLKTADKREEQEIPVKAKENDKKSGVGESSMSPYEIQGVFEDDNVISVEACNNVKFPHSFENNNQSLEDEVQSFEIYDDSNDEAVAKENAQTNDSHIEMIICCNSSEKSETLSGSGEIILTVESDKELVWSNDFMSQVISSSGILKRRPELVRNSGSIDSSSISYSLQLSDGDTKQIEEMGCEQNIEKRTRKENARSCDKLISSARPVEVLSSKSYPARKSKGARRKTCDVCGIFFRQHGELEQHESTHHGIRVKCNLCDDTFAFSKSLRNHYLRKHSNDGNFRCEECNKSFKCRSNLWSHRFTHTSQEDRRFTCPECPQRFNTRSKLNVHLQSHTGEKKFQCGECQKGFIYQGLLLRHMRKHFPESETFLSDDQSIYMVEVGEKTSEDSIAQH
ncbi:PR domain zinc finger protein 5-like isoform X2 [Penaeus japonicus]|uniref:PR domain zinc finger protein 5-like isoform X2 n=1 Tax=Penaeus japonicus TaxID=27405 RepID=UPI001C71325E|nr:PR domain zinc finger protein 5-like isoform X2 [Penaeus japonicus]